MREIDDRYPEFAEAKEPRRRGKHHKGLNWVFFATSGLFVSTMFILNAPPSSAIKPVEAKNVTVTIDVESIEEEYSGDEYVISPEYTFTALEGDQDVSDSVTVSLKPGTEFKARDAGTYPFGLTASSFDVAVEGYDDNTVVVNDGSLTIKPAEVTVTITGNNAILRYDRRIHEVEGYELTDDSEIYDLSNVSFKGEAKVSGIYAGKTFMGLSSSQFSNDDPNFNVSFDITDGYLQILRTNVNVNIIGNSNTLTYDGTSHSVSGYYAEIDNPVYSENLIAFDGYAEVSRTSVGTSTMGLSPEKFRSIDNNFSVTFSVTDGYIKINEPENKNPTIRDLDVYDNVNMDMVEFAGVSFMMKPNEVAKAGGKAVFNVYVKKEDGTFEKDDEYPYEYIGEGDDSEVEIYVLHRMPEDKWRIRETGKLVGEYTYPDGSTGRYESEEFYMYKGSFVNLNWDYGEYGILLNGNKIEVDLIFDETVEFDDGETMSVSRDNVEIIEASAHAYVYDSDDNYVEELSSSKDMPDSVEYFTDDEGLLHMHLIYNFDIDVDPGAAYEVYTGFYAEFYDKASGWNAALW
ncbi:MAG: hypothetical protein IKE33_05080 [Erysipelotrichaceae bacterium]|nr:hypothetical protein [Erysipelotrichaceae bacterium]